MLAWMPTATRFMIRFDAWYRVLSSALLLLPSESYIEVGSENVAVQMGWGFSARFPRGSVARISRMSYKPISRGVHGFAGRWLVNGSGDQIAEIELMPPARGYVMGFPIKLKQLLISVDDPDGLSAALG
jgi:hypothetical protein